MKFVVPGLEIQNENNIRGHWAQECARAKKQKSGVSAVLKGRLKPVIAITLTRLSSRELDQGNLANAFKYVQDTVAKELRIDDGSKAIHWEYRWAKSKEPAIWIEMESFAEFEAKQAKANMTSLLEKKRVDQTLECVKQALETLVSTMDAMKKEEG